ncbi:MAG: LCP family protein [Eubacteriales bacterium]
MNDNTVNPSPEEPTKKEKHKKKKTPVTKSQIALRISLIVLGVLILILLTAGIAVYALFSHYYNLFNVVDPFDTDSPYYSKEEIIWEIPDETDDPNDIYNPPVTSQPGDNPSTGDAPSTGGTPSTGDTPSTQVPPVTDTPITIEGPPTEDSGYVMQFSDKVKNILLIGTDGRTANERGRSDSMILLSINEETGQIVMTSLMRDIYLHIPVVDTYNRINAAYAYGGVSLLAQTIEENFKIHIDKYVRINFTGFEKVINILGGVDVRLSAEEIKFVGLEGKASPGLVHLDGAAALKFCRCRYLPRNGLGGDFARTARQRELLTLVSDKLRTMSLTEINNLLNKFLPEVTTNLTKDELLSMLTKITSYFNYDIKSYSLPISGSWKYATIRGMSVLSVDFKKNYEALEKMIKGTYES